MLSVVQPHALTKAQPAEGPNAQLALRRVLGDEWKDPHRFQFRIFAIPRFDLLLGTRLESRDTPGFFTNVIWRQMIQPVLPNEASRLIHIEDTARLDQGGNQVADSGEIGCGILHGRKSLVGVRG